MASIRQCLRNHRICDCERKGVGGEGGACDSNFCLERDSGGAAQGHMLHGAVPPNCHFETKLVTRKHLHAALRFFFFLRIIPGVDLSAEGACKQEEMALFRLGSKQNKKNHEISLSDLGYL